MGEVLFASFGNDKYYNPLMIVPWLILVPWLIFTSFVPVDEGKVQQLLLPRLTDEVGASVFPLHAFESFTSRYDIEAVAFDIIFHCVPAVLLVKEIYCE